MELSKLLEMAKAKLGSTEEEMASRLSQLEKAKKDLDSAPGLVKSHAKAWQSTWIA